MSEPVIIEAAINGATPKSVNPNVPVTEDEIVADALACLEAGAAIVHQHISSFNVSGDEAAEVYLGIWRRVLAEQPDALWYPTINLGPPAQWYDHIPPLAQSGLLRMGVSDPGSVNMGVPVDGLPVGSFVYANTFDDVAHQLGLCRTHQLGPSLAIYEPGFLRTVLAYHRSGQLPPGSFIKLYFSSERGLSGTAFGLPPSATALAAYVELLDGTGLPWAVSAVGADLVRSELCGAALDAGGHLHVGLEFYAGDRTPTNVELVTEAVEAAAAVGRAVATSADAAALLGLPRTMESAPR
ncbi:3-keto-5-aminohexanoate cleavage protein [Mycobacterium paraintracellulare]|uniref:3-keto-5-aminohexanoate cleavage protein n=1 Tax=Mycobacterium paraintracellulare TaxID=1138383 RepID=UPI001EEEB601|nr:3-keto-5-aminohexanoate cleavage protein [Mycobacterium paraintracellulare]WVL47972.1 3-keto-5-aminohexanoate cleavage protein [Mycobacterium paraintracellulare]